MGDIDPKGKTEAAPLELTPLGRATTPDEQPPLLGNRYELLGMLGAGAMGTVYRARDRELDEVVALKVLKKEIASADMIERFRREVKLARRVTHRNVARTFDIGEDGGDRFLTMEFVEGEMLAALLARKGRLPLGDVVRIGLDICAGLSAAHAAGVLHRDLKPENVIVAKDGRAVITDFGIARAASQEELSRTVGGVVGTPAYMAPEQVEGSADLDARADLYALGTMLFELITGRLAWQGDSIMTIAVGRLLRPPPDVRTLVPATPTAIAELVLKLMARRREDRYPDAAQAAQALQDALATSTLPMPAAPSSRTVAAAPALRTERAVGARVVAVLPVLNLGATDDAYLVENVSEDVTDLLSVVPGILVRPRGDTARFDDPKRDVREIGRGVGADVVVDASLRRLGEAVRASFRLIAVEDGFQLWAKRFDRPPAEVLSIADDAAHAIARALTSELGTSRARPTSPEAEDLFLRGRYLIRRGWPEVVREGVELLARAHELSPSDPRIMGTYALALARLYGMEFFGRDVENQARTLANEASTLEPRQAEAKTALALLHLQNQDGIAAAGYLRAALAVAPNSTDALDWLGRLLSEVGRVDESLALFARASAVDPENLQPRHQIARMRSFLGDHAGMIETLGPMPEHVGDVAPWFVTQARDAVWRRDAAFAARLAQLLQSVTLPPTLSFAVKSLLAITAGNTSGVDDRSILERALPIDASRGARRATFNAQLRAELLAFVGARDEAIAAIRAAEHHGLLDIVWLERCPLFDQLRDHATFVEVAERIAQRAKRVLDAVDARSPTGL